MNPYRMSFGWAKNEICEYIVYGYCTMETPQVKSEIVRAIQDLREDATVEDAMERLYFSREG